jgi:hypothetical protein
LIRAPAEWHNQQIGVVLDKGTEEFQDAAVDACTRSLKLARLAKHHGLEEHHRSAAGQMNL